MLMATGSEPGGPVSVDMASLDASLINTLKLTQVLRFSCSEIAGIAGYNPWQDETMLFEKYIYQDLNELRELDASNLGIELLTVEDEIDLLLEKFDAEDRKRLKELDTKLQVADNLDDNAKANEFLREVALLMKEERVVNRVSEADLKLVEEEFSGRIKKGYGVTCENAALDKYESLTGFTVSERNMQYIRMKVMPLEEEKVDVDPKNVFNTLLAQSKKTSQQQKQYMDLVSSSGLFASVKPASGGPGLAVRKNSRVSKYVRPAFLLIGKVDGISYQLDMAHEDPSAWTETKVVVEMKSRVNRIHSPPPIYEQIQLISYLMILSCPCGDLVQSISNTKKRKAPPTSSERDEGVPKVVVKNTNEVHYDDNFSISRVNLDGPPYYHSKHWHEVILPRLRKFHEAVLSARRDDGVRYAFLLATPEERRAMLYKMCPYFEEAVQVDCSTSSAGEAPVGDSQPPPAGSSQADSLPETSNSSCSSSAGVSSQCSLDVPCRDLTAE